MVANWERRNTPNYSNRSRYADTVLPGTVLDVGFPDDLYARCGPYAIRGLCAGLLLLNYLAEHVFGFGGGAILTGFVVLFDGRQNTLNRVAISCVPANFEFAGQPVQETGGGNNRQAVIGYRNFVAPEHTA